jgi:hypothetical protein
MKEFKKLLYSDENSYAVKMRRKRFGFFLQLLEKVPDPIHILDIGGSQWFWEVMGFTNKKGCHVTLLNLTQPQVKYDNFTGIAGDATDLSEIQTNQFDIVFSNSVIEHVGSYDNQKLMARGIQRVGKRYFVQTPNYFFPIEPHFLFLGFHWLPISVRINLIRKFNIGWIKKRPELDEAKTMIESIQLLKKKELLALFPHANLYEEKFLGMTKSFVVYNEW